MKEIIAGLLLGLAFSFIIINSIERENALVNRYCSQLQGFYYGECQASIY